jgi:ribonuclease HI
MLRAFKTVALPVLEVESALEPTAYRLRRRAIEQVARFYSLPDDNPAKLCALTLAKQPHRFQSPAGLTYKAISNRINPTRHKLVASETPWILPPWTDPTSGISILDGKKAKAYVAGIPAHHQQVLYTDGSVNSKLSGAAVVQDYGIQTRTIWSATIGWARTCPILDAELKAILQALLLADDTGRQRFITIVSDSQEALQTLSQGNKTRRARGLAREIAVRLMTLRNSRKTVTLVWVPAHDNIPGNESADRAAKTTTTPNKRPSSNKGDRHRSWKEVIKLIRQDVGEMPRYTDLTAGPGKYTWSLDYALPGNHTLAMYKALTSDEASILIQARTGKSRLNSSLYQIRAVESSACECGQGPETVHHVLATCPRWKLERERLKTEVGHHWGNISALLGAWTPRQDFRTGEYLQGPRSKWRANMRVVKATIRFFAATGRLNADREQNPQLGLRSSVIQDV